MGYSVQSLQSKMKNEAPEYLYKNNTVAMIKKKTLDKITKTLVKTDLVMLQNPAERSRIYMVELQHYSAKT